MARVGRPSTFILHSLGTRAGTGPRADVFDDVRAADSAPLPPPRARTAPKRVILAMFPSPTFLSKTANKFSYWLIFVFIVI